jgi:hypothetical protein
MTTDYFPARETEFPRAEVIGRKDFVDQFARDYKSGQHLTAIGPTQRGKSRLTRELTQRVISPSRRLMVLLGKPPGRERTWDDKAARSLNLHITSTFPPDPMDWRPWWERIRYGRDSKRNGYLLRPHHTMTDLDADDAEMYRQFKAGIAHAYKSTKLQWIILVDEAHHVQVDLKLKKQCEAPLMRGAPDCAIWHNLQRGRNVSMLCYDAPEHILIFRDDDKGNQQRYSEIGGVDSRYLSHLTRNLKTRRVPSGGTISQAIYFRRADNSVRIVDT